MTTMSEYRMWISVAGLPFEEESRWEPLAAELQREHGEMGPIMSWDSDDAVIVLGGDAADEAEAARLGTRAVVSALHATGMGSLYPRSLMIELVSEPERSAATA